MVVVVVVMMMVVAEGLGRRGRGSMQTIKQNKQAGGVSGDVEKIVFGGLVTLANA